MKNRGFTLIELLAVIVILAIISIIATPIILNIINDARMSSKDRTAELIVHSLKLAYSAKYSSKGDQPTLDEVIDQLQKSGINNATIDDNGIISTKDDVVCKIGQVGSKVSMNCEGISQDVNLDLDGLELKKYTGTIYRDGSLGHTNKYIGNSISEYITVYCVVHGDQNSCDSGLFINSSEECSTLVSSMQGQYPGAYCSQEERVGFTEYTKDISKLTYSNYYLKHDVVDDVVTTGYICVNYELNSEEKTVCVQGKDPAMYGDENSGNVKKLRGLQSEGFDCSFSGTQSSCEVGGATLLVKSDGEISYMICRISNDGSSYCD